MIVVDMWHQVFGEVPIASRALSALPLQHCLKVILVNAIESKSPLFRLAFSTMLLKTISGGSEHTELIARLNLAAPGTLLNARSATFTWATVAMRPLFANLGGLSLAR